MVVEPMGVWVDPGLLARFLFLSGAPAFVVGLGIVHTCARFGISEEATFMIAMPLLLGIWYYFVGWLIDRRRARRSSRRASSTI